MRVARSAAMLVAVLTAALGLASTASAATTCAGSGYLASGSAIQRFSTTSNAVTGTVTLTTASPTLVDLAVSPDGAKLYAADQAHGKVLVIDTATNAQTAEIAVGTAPVAIAIAPDGATAYVANSTANSISVITLATGAVATVAVGAAPSDVAISANGTKVYVSATDGVHVYSGGALGGAIAGTANATALALSPDGATLYAATGATVTPITTATGVAGTPIALAAQALGTAPTGATLYAGTATAGAASLVARTDTGATSIGTASSTGTTAVAVKPDGSAIYALGASRLDVVGPTGTALGSIAGTGLAALAVCPAVVPDPPTAVKGVPGDKQIDVSWTAPVDTGGAAITGYTVTAAPGGATCATTGAVTCTVTGLRNATAYTFTVVARTIAGASAPSKASARVTPRKDTSPRKLTIGVATATVTRRGVSVALDVTATGPGVIALVAKYKAARACSVSKRVNAAGVTRVRCALTASARALARRRAATYTLLVTFSPANGPLAAARTSVIVPRRR